MKIKGEDTKNYPVVIWEFVIWKQRKYSLLVLLESRTNTNTLRKTKLKQQHY
jgi:hypothetical protein